MSISTCRPASRSTSVTCAANSAGCATEPPYLDDPKSYSVIVESGVVAIDLASLNALMTQTLAGDNSNVNNVKVSVDDKATCGRRARSTRPSTFPSTSRPASRRRPDGKPHLHEIRERLRRFDEAAVEDLQHRDGRSAEGQTGPRRRGARQRLDPRSVAAAAGAVDARRHHQRAHRRRCDRADLRHPRRPSPVAAADVEELTSTGAAARSRSAN